MNEHSMAREYAHVVCTQGTVAGEPRIAGHRIRVRDVVAARDLGGFTPEEIAATVYPDLTLGEVYAALAYYEDHREEIDQAGCDEDRTIEEFRRRHPQLVQPAAVRGRPVLKAYADEHVAFPIVQALRQRGMDVVTVQQRGREGPRTPNSSTRLSKTGASC